MNLNFAPAKREHIIPLIGLFGKSGSGKTLSALKIARGIVGPSGRIAVTDTENRRASHFADDPSVAPFLSLDLQPPYGPDQYRACHAEACKVADIHIIDSASHEWTGEGGCLQLVEKVLDEKAGNNWQQRDKWKMAAWGKVTPQHDMLVNALMRSQIPVICCFRAKDKVVMEKVEEQGRQKTEISTDENAPISRKDLIYEMLMALEVHQDEKDGVQSGGYFRIRKPGPPSLDRLLREFKDERLSPKIGQLIADWCRSPGGPGTAPAKSATTADLKKLKKQLWDLLSAKFGTELTAVQHANQFLWDEGIISDTENLSELAAGRIQEILPKVTAKLQSST